MKARRTSLAVPLLFALLALAPARAPAAFITDLGPTTQSATDLGAGGHLDFAFPNFDAEFRILAGVTWDLSYGSTVAGTYELPADAAPAFLKPFRSVLFQGTGAIGGGSNLQFLPFAAEPGVAVPFGSTSAPIRGQFEAELLLTGYIAGPVGLRVAFFPATVIPLFGIPDPDRPRPLFTEGTITGTASLRYEWEPRYPQLGPPPPESDVEALAAYRALVQGPAIAAPEPSGLALALPALGLLGLYRLRARRTPLALRSRVRDGFGSGV